MPEIAYLNGKWMSPSDAFVSAEDRGYSFGDGLYEVFITYAGRVWALERHLLRLRRSMRELDITGIDVAEIRDVVNEAISRSEMDNVIVYVQVTRGVAIREHDWPEGLRPSVFLTVRPRREVDPRIYEEGVSAITTPEIRWDRCDIKSLNLLPNCLALHAAHRAGAHDAIFVTSDDIVTEAAKCSVLIVRDGTLIAREDGPHALPGITQGLFIETAHRLNIPLERRPFTRDEMMNADEVFFTTTTLGAVPITRIDDKPTGGRGEIFAKLLTAYWERRDLGDDAVEPGL